MNEFYFRGRIKIERLKYFTQGFPKINLREILLEQGGKKLGI